MAKLPKTYDVSRYIYRAKRLGENKGWVYGGYHQFLPITPSPIVPNDYVKKNAKLIKHIIVSEGFSDWNMPRELVAIEVDPKTVCQCTGIIISKTDTLYEEDIVKYQGKLHIVRWDAKRVQFVLDEVGDYVQPVIKEIPTSDVDSMVLIGNSFDDVDILLDCEWI